ncbi:hypothetical protein C8Q79DRAFT_911014 [Trametes meyenii]|nr:hypothetical protein C8Q79DRAFT_911014 [Trametes meyenii]
MLDFWEKCAPWLTARGYSLYPRWRPDPHADPRLSRWRAPASSMSASFPYATCIRNQLNPDRMRIPPSKIAWAQDILHRDIVLKLIDTDSVEYGIYQTLLRCKKLSNSKPESTGPGVLPPLAILETPFRYSIVAMPRWGDEPLAESLNIVADIFQFMRCTLQGLSVLHTHRIAHRDITNPNILVNCYDPTTEIMDEGMLAEHRRSGAARYCLFDFNLSIQLPPDTCLRNCRRPAIEAYTAMTSYIPDDTFRGEPWYNPFAFDVACLGNMFRTFYWGATATVPMLAPLFDMMTTHNLDRRFTAEEALEFLDYVWSQLSKDTRNAPLSLEVDFGCQTHPEMYWDLTPPRFDEQWRHYKAPPRSVIVQFLTRFLQIPYVWRLVLFTRDTLNM